MNSNLTNFLHSITFKGLMVVAMAVGFFSFNASAASWQGQPTAKAQTERITIDRQQALVVSIFDQAAHPILAYPHFQTFYFFRFAIGAFNQGVLLQLRRLQEHTLALKSFLPTAGTKVLSQEPDDEDHRS